ncbi:MAG TPA: hypothetical protein VGP47_05860, partial [Parachlamydiaceae bacterium]|nr:hypothetical protein [Parachlamydiaceae bacterium]
MSPCISTAAVFLIACHGGPADHFATYAEVLAKQGHQVHIQASGPALKKFQERGIEVKSPFSLDNLTIEEEDCLAQTIAKTCSTASVVLTDIGHIFDIKIQKALSLNAPGIPRFAYYDNPEPFVPGGYSSTAAEVIAISHGVLFANETLAKAKIYSAADQEISFDDKKRFGIGYYPIAQAEKIAEKRKIEHADTRSTFLAKNDIADTGQKILVYFGGNNEEYYSKAFPAFLSLIAETALQIDFNNTVIVIQQHPGAKVKNQDGLQVEAWVKVYGEQTVLPRVVVSNFSSDQAQVLADAALYYQTSMGPQFVLEGIPTIQIGHETFDDILVRNHLAPSVTSVTGLIQAMESLDQAKAISPQDILSSLGIREDWQETLQ